MFTPKLVSAQLCIRTRLADFHVVSWTERIVNRKYLVDDLIQLLVEVSRIVRNIIDAVMTEIECGVIVFAAGMLDEQ